MFEIPTDLRITVEAAAQREEVRSAVEAVYREVGAAVDARKPRCDISGRCCRFEQYGHSLFITTIELATFFHGLQVPAPAAGPTPAWDGTGCPFQLAKLCGVHAVRPFGCRIFFCDPASTEWQHELYALMHQRLRNLHDHLNVPYHYMEWRNALVALGLAGSVGASFAVVKPA